MTKISKKKEKELISKSLEIHNIKGRLNKISYSQVLLTFKQLLENESSIK